MVQIKRIYDAPAVNDGYRILVDRLWPRGIKKENALVDLWLKDVAPSTELRKWFNHEPDKWPAFVEAYRKELSKSAALNTLIQYINQHKNVTLVYAAKDEDHNQAKALLGMLKHNG